MKAKEKKEREKKDNEEERSVVTQAMIDVAKKEVEMLEDRIETLLGKITEVRSNMNDYVAQITNLKQRGLIVKMKEKIQEFGLDFYDIVEETKELMHMSELESQGDENQSEENEENSESEQSEGEDDEGERRDESPLPKRRKLN
jgi:hypothetical protein